jgi:hypothetical protein
MVIKKPIIKVIGSKARLCARFEIGDQQNELWYGVDEKYQGWFADERSDAFVLALLPLAMLLKENIIVEGGMSALLRYNLTAYFINIFRKQVPRLSPVEIFAQDLNSKLSKVKANNVVTGFSAGVDSFCVFLDHNSGRVPENFKVTHFLFNNVGSHNDKTKKVFESRYEKLAQVANEIGVPILKLDSNLSEILDPYFTFQETHTIRNASAALSFQNSVSRFYYASGCKVEDCYVGFSSDMAYSDPIILNLFSTEQIQCISSGSQYSRVDKTRIIADFSFAQQYLDVCVEPIKQGEKINCSSCFKCLRTMLTLEILGKLNKFNKVFNIEVYNKKRTSYIKNILISDDPFATEIKGLAKKENFEFPIVAYWLSYSPTNMLRRIKKWVYS